MALYHIDPGTTRAAPSPLSALLENVSVYSEARPEALLNKPVDCVLLGVSVSGAWGFITSLVTGIARPSATPRILAHAVFEIKKGT